LVELTFDPKRWESDVVTADGATVHVRTIRPDDAERLLAFHARQSAESIYFRYFSPHPRLSPAEVAHLTEVNFQDRMAFVAIVDDELVGTARYDRWPDRDEAEVAFFIDDEHRGRGLATILLEYLAAAARESGVGTFVAHVLPSNRRMLSVFRQAGFAVTSKFADGVVEVSLGLEPTPEAVAAMAERGRSAEARSVARLLEPSSIAVVGAGRERGGIGHEVFRRLLEHDFGGVVYPVNRDAEHVASVRAYKTVLDIPDRVDVAVVAVPADEVKAVIEDCARAHIGGVVVLSAGFAETGTEGEKVELEIVELVRRHGMRLLGPNSLGLINTAPAVRLHATFVPLQPEPGGVALSSQSGTLAAAILNRATALGIGVSSAVSVGNKADVSGNDLLRYWEIDDRTDVVMLYLESFGNPRRFGRIATEVSRKKPIVAVMSGHDRSTDVLLGQTGVIRVATLDQLLDVSRVLASQPVPPGEGVVILGNYGGPAVLAADACADAGLVLAELSTATKAALSALLPKGARVANPVDLTHLAGAHEYEHALRLVLSDNAVDQALVLYAPPLWPGSRDVARGIVAAASEIGTKTVVASFCADPSATFDAGGGRPIPNFTFPDAAAYALGRATDYGAWRSEPAGAVPDLADVHRDAARAIVERALDDAPEGRRLSMEETLALLDAAALPVLDGRLVCTADGAVAAAHELGLPVALKATGLEHLAKTEAGGLALDLHDDTEVAHAFERMHAHLGTAMEPGLVQRMTDPGVDLRLRIGQDPVVGTIAAIGPGGAGNEAAPDTAVRIAPLTDLTASRLAAVAVTDDLDPAQRSAVELVLLRLSALADAVPELVELVLNPVIVNDTGVWVTNARARVAPWQRDLTPSVRRL
jgi:acyl-CoA synthetase (NDP forming)/RimJ/RimL family protein N-acetyltransferase